jgi:hypothetical protein
MKRFIALVTALSVAALASLSLASGASASGEVAKAGLTMTPRKGKIYKNVRTPVNWRVDVEITAPYPANPKVLPMKRVRTTFPTDMAFNPKKNTPVCGDSEIGPPPVNLNVEPDEAISRCPKAVLGNGTAQLYLAQNNGPTGPNLKDPVLVVFNGGTTKSGLPKIKIYGYSKGTGAGVYMEGTLNKGVLDVQIPVLTFDSGTGEFNLNIPGRNSPFKNRRGVDPTYVEAKCSTGKWITNAQFTLGTRDTAGNPTSPDTIINAPEEVQDCKGAPGGKSGLKVSVKGPGKAKAGKKATFKVKVKNNGSKAVKGVKVKASGKGAKGSGKAGKIPAGKARTVKVKVKFSKKGKSKVTFKATGKGTKAGKATKVVKVR